jgi:hypothetical protein
MHVIQHYSTGKRMVGQVEMVMRLLRGSVGRICHLENVKSCMSYLQQYTKIIKKLILKTYFS